MSKTLTEVLNGHLTNRRWGFKKLASQAGVPRNTVYRWTTTDEPTSVRHGPDLARVAWALGLNRHETNALLATGGQPTIDALLEQEQTEEDRELLLRWPPVPPSNFPNHLTSFVGRDEDLGRLARLIASARLITLTGPGGSGKTRLALEAAGAVLDEFAEGVFVDLAPISDPGLVLLAVSRALGLRESLDEPVPVTLATHLRERRVLLVLDNFEQVIATAPLVTNLLQATRWVKVLVTSRTILNVRGEHAFEVTPLPLPSLSAGFDELASNPSVALFSDRARAVDSAFDLAPANSRLVATICAHLEGLPLGIELAAARTRQVGLPAMLNRFPSRLELTNTGPADAPVRQQTLRAAIAWSYNLLEDGEQRLFGCASVFVGGFTIEAALAVCAALGHDRIDVAASLESLADWNLLRRIPGVADEPRYGMLETIREFGLEILRETGRLHAARQAHADFFLALAGRAHLPGDGPAGGPHGLAGEQENVVSALGWYCAQGQWDEGLRLCAAQMPLWHAQDRLRESRSWLETFMVHADHVSPGARASGLLWQGLLLLRGPGDVHTASRIFDEALALFRREGDLNGASEALQAVGDAHRQRDDWELASQQYRESLNLAEQTGNAYLVAHAWYGLALCAQEIDKFDDAQHNWEQMLTWAERSGNRATVAMALNSLGEMARYRGEWKDAARYYEQTLTLARELGSEFRMALALHNLGYVALAGGEVERAGTLFIDSLVLYAEGQYNKGVAECLSGLGKAETAAGNPERAAKLCGASEAILKDLHTQLDTLDRADYVRTLSTLESELGERLEPLLKEGRAMSIARAVEYAVAGIAQ